MDLHDDKLKPYLLAPKSFTANSDRLFNFYIKWDHKEKGSIIWDATLSI